MGKTLCSFDVHETDQHSSFHPTCSHHDIADKLTLNNNHSLTHSVVLSIIVLLVPFLSWSVLSIIVLLVPFLSWSIFSTYSIAFSNIFFTGSSSRVFDWIETEKHHQISHVHINYMAFNITASSWELPLTILHRRKK
jgi:hypothetical protein